MKNIEFAFFTTILERANPVDGITLFMSDYLIIIIMLTLTLVLGLVAYHHHMETKFYLAIGIAILAFIGIKLDQMKDYISVSNNFLLGMEIFLALLLLGYIIILAREHKILKLRFEIVLLFIIAFFGILLLIENTEGVIIFLGLEIQAFTYYTLVSMGHKNISSVEGALKYFLLGAMASGMFILGLGLLYGVTGKTNLLELSEIAEIPNSVMILGGLLIIIGLLFKIGAVPFHFWLPDAYEGAPMYVLLFLISFPKISLFYILYQISHGLESYAVIIISLVLSGIIGSTQAVEQTKIKRFLAYSLVFNNAFFLAMLLLTGKQALYSLCESLIFYIVIIMTTVITIQILRHSQTKQNLSSIRDLLSLRNSNTATSILLMAVFFSAAGIPPLLGFFQKYIILFQLAEQFQIFLVIFLIALSILPAFYYIRLPKTLYFLSGTKHVLLEPVNAYNATVLALGTMLTLSVFY